MNYKDYNDEELVMYIREDSEDASEILYEKYKPLVQKIVKRFYPYVINSGLEQSDLMQEGMLSLHNAVYHYREEKDHYFYTFARTCIERKIISVVLSANRQKHKILNESLSLNYQSEDKDASSFDTFLGDDSQNPLNQLVMFEQEHEVINQIRELLTEREKMVFDLKIAGFHYQEIASMLETSTKSIDNAMQRIRNKAREKMNLKKSKN